MKFKLDGYNDCGKCSMGSLMDDYDTEKNHIFVDREEVKIEKVEDLFPYLWDIAGISTSSPEGRNWFFIEPMPWWESEYGNRIVSNKKEIAKYEKKLKNPKSDKLKQKYEEEIKWRRDSIRIFSNVIEHNNASMEEQKKKLIEANK